MKFVESAKGVNAKQDRSQRLTAPLTTLETKKLVQNLGALLSTQLPRTSSQLTLMSRQAPTEYMKAALLVTHGNVYIMAAVAARSAVTKLSRADKAVCIVQYASCSVCSLHLYLALPAPGIG